MLPQTMSREINMNEENNLNKEEMLKRLLDRQAFPWSEGVTFTIGDLISASAQKEAARTIETLNQGISLSPAQVITKVKPRAASWQFPQLLDPYSDNAELPLEDFSSLVAQREQELNTTLEGLPPGQEPSKEMAGQKWVANTLGYETRAAVRRQIKAKQEKEKLRQETLSSKIQQLKRASDPQYKDAFNKMVSQKLDEVERTSEVPAGQSGLAYAETIVRKELESSIGDEELERFLYQKLKEQKERGLSNILQRGITQLKDQQKALDFAAIMFEVDQRKTENTWQNKRFEETIMAGLKGEAVNLISMVCCINQFNPDGSYTPVPDLFAYNKNPKLEPVPLIIDELVLVTDFLKFYGVNSTITIYISDTDYTEIGQFGEITKENLENLNAYLENLKRYASSKSPNLQIVPISALTANNPAYDQVKARVLQNVTEFSDPDFSREWYQKFEDASEKVRESQLKRKLFPSEQIIRKSQEITRNIWAVNAAQGVVFGNLGPNTILVSTERRERDLNYAIDKSARANFPPVIYILKAAEQWNRKLTGKVD